MFINTCCNVISSWENTHQVTDADKSVKQMSPPCPSFLPPPHLHQARHTQEAGDMLLLPGRLPALSVKAFTRKLATQRAGPDSVWFSSVPGAFPGSACLIPCGLQGPILQKLRSTVMTKHGEEQ